MAGFENSSSPSSDKDIARPRESTPNRSGDAQTNPYGKNGQDSLKIIQGQENGNSYPENSISKSQERGPLASLQNELNHLIPKGDHHKYTVTLSRKNGGPFIDIQGGDTKSFNNFYSNVQMNCNESFWNNINAITAKGQKVSFSVGGAEAQTAHHPKDIVQAPADHPTMQKLEPRLDTPTKPTNEAAKPTDADAQIIESKLAHLIPAGVHLKFTKNSFEADKYVDPKQWTEINKAVKDNPDLVNAIRHKMGSSNHLEISSSHQVPVAQAKDTHSTSAPDKDGVFRFNTAVNDLKASAQTYSGQAQETYEPMYLGGHVFLNGQDIKIDPRANMPIPAEARDGYPIGAKLIQNSSGIQSMQGVLHTEGNAKFFRVQRIIYDSGPPDVGQNLVDIPLTKQDKNGVARYGN